MKMKQDELPVKSSPPTRSVLLIVESFKTARWAFTIAGLVLMVYFGIAVPAREAAGSGDLTVIYGALLQLRTILPLAGIAAFAGLWLRERYLRKTTVARENRRNRELEQKIDSGRTSSGFKEDE